MALRRARGDESLRGLAARVGVSKSALARYESGSALPSGDVLERLDRELEQHGALLTIADSDATRLEDDGTTFSWHLYSADWAGPVWIRVRPAGKRGPRRLVLDWGPWSRRVEGDLDDIGIVLDIGLARRSGLESVPISLRSDKEVHVHWGLGLPVGFSRVLDITDGWFVSDQDQLLDAAAAMIRDALAVRGRSFAEFAEFLGVDVETIEQWLEGP